MSQLINYGESIQLTKETIKQYICEKASDQECQMFFELCKMHKLNPFAGDAHLVKYGTTPAQPVVTEKAWNRKLNEISDLVGVEDGVIIKTQDGLTAENEGEYFDDKDTLLGGWCKVYIKNKMPVTAKIRLKDYNKAQAMWKQIPARMINKTARVQAIRKAIPEMANMYTEEEMDGVNGVKNKQTINITPESNDQINAEYSLYKKKLLNASKIDQIKNEIGPEIRRKFSGEDLDRLMDIGKKKIEELKNE